MYKKSLSDLLFLILSLIDVTISSNCDKVVNVTSCPTTKKEWREAELRLACLYECPRVDYHCVPDQKGNLVEVCTKSLPLPVGMCPMYDTIGKRFQRGKCFEEKGYCVVEENVYRTTDLYKHPFCWQTKDISTIGYISTTSSSTTACTSSIWVIACALLFFLVLDLPNPTMFYFVK